MAQHIPEVGDIFLATEIGGKTTGPYKRVEFEDAEPGVIYAVQRHDVQISVFGIKDYTFMDAPGDEPSAF